jgi:hypothetical protein
MKNAVGVAILYPKFRPDIVTEMEFDNPRLLWPDMIFDTSGASKLNSSALVPTTAATVSRALLFGPE